MEKRHNTQANKNIEQTYVDHLFTKEAENPRTAHYFEGVNPREAKNIKKEVDKYKEQLARIEELKRQLKESGGWPKEIPETASTSSDASTFEVKNSKVKPLGYIRNLFKAIGALTLFSTLFGSRALEKNTNSLPVLPENKKAKKDFVKQGTFDQVLTPEELEIRRKTVQEFLSDSSDIYSYEDQIASIVTDIENKQKQLDSLMKSGKPFKSIKRQVEVLKIQIESEKNLIKEISQIKELLLNNNKKYLKNRDSIKSKEIIDVYRDFDRQKKWLRDKINSQEYLSRLTKEFEGDELKALAEQKKRLAELEKDYILESKEAIDEAVPGSAAYYRLGEKTHLPSNSSGVETMGAHEYQHQSTRGGEMISTVANDLYREGFDPSKTTKEIVVNGKTGEEYFGDPTELDARKKELEFKMEELGIKKYGEEFTEKHLRKLLKLQKKGMIQNDFLKMTKPEYLIKIMNTIAANDKDNKNQETLS